MPIEQKMWEVIGLPSFTVFKKIRVMDFIMPGSSMHADIPAQLDGLFLQRHKVVPHMADLLYIFKV